MSCSISKLIKTSTAVQAAIKELIIGMFGTGAGEVAEGNHTHDIYANKGGDPAQKFKVANGTVSDEAVRLSQLIARTKIINDGTEEVGTGNIIESGETSGKYWTKFADGTMIQWGEVVESLTTSNSHGAVYFASSADLYYPVVFTSVGAVKIDMTIGSGLGWGTTASNNTTRFVPRLIGTQDSTTISSWRWSAIGRWK